ncbi:hypothetical protein N658DRAFT_518398 [Parathielavia hyrcaniae]|uniref:Uncharacterized protein n=1 Tax=Parathielavia hyrcaniae TaxID=113614 RepID=A0AAN6PWB8_9PEZI|nr:hypothetical protein N658DRAFT_518398 [Parathielavia hyrcaniae]
MRDTVLASVFLASATLASANRLECLTTRSRELAVAASCGDKGSINYCFSNLPAPTQPEAVSPELERCFVSAGCTPEEARVEAYWALRRCDAASADLRRGRRHNDASPLAGAANEPILAIRNPLPAGAVRAMPLDARQETTTDAAAAPATTTFNDNESSPSPCFTDSPTEITVCPTQTTGADAGSSLSCFPTATTTPKCRDGLICQSDPNGNPSCMYKQSSLGIEGTIIAIVFASAIVLSVVAVCFMCCRERREHRRIERAAEAARIAKEAKTSATVAAKRPGASVTGGTGAGGGAAEASQPLMYHQADGGASGGPQQHYPPPMPPMPQGYGAANPFADAAHDGHPLR